MVGEKFRIIPVPKTQIKVIKHSNNINLPQQCACQAGLCTELTPGGLLQAGVAAVWQDGLTISPGSEPE